ncbi:hypothetical protein SAVIM40S_02455 [Streptomyces avidinii]
MWCAHTVAESPVIAIVAPTRATYPKMGFRLNTGTISLTTPKKGSATI